MNKTLCFAKRNLIEISRDALSYIFCIAFPIVMLVVMTLVNESIPKEANMTIFRIDSLSGGIGVFGQTFVMLFTAMAVSRDRSGSFLIRMFASPMKSSNFTNGYILPMLLVAVVQWLVSFAAAVVVAKVVDYDVKPQGLLLATVVLIPSAILFIAIGLILGTLFNQNAAPGLCSVIISLGSFMGGIWFDVESSGGVLYKICKCMPFIYCTKSARAAIHLDFGTEAFLIPLLVVTSAAVVLTIIAAAVFNTKMKADLS
ncbi:MAG: ABC transporter permease [Lachnospiraceae bacterium]|nr:ABC transporter permease [Lachnospiraceae bacterium]